MKVMGWDAETILSSNDTDLLRQLLAAAEEVRLAHRGDEVYARGLIEYSNQCQRDCLYCGLRLSNRSLHRYRLEPAEIIARGVAMHKLGISSIALQAGESNSDREVSRMAGVIRELREIGMRDGSPGLGVTLSMGEMTYQQYKRLYEAGAHRYLLRIESSDRKLFGCIHPLNQIYERRLECLSYLKDIGYQVGSGVMIGLPGQSYASLAADLQFFVERDIDMLGMGPYIPHPHTPLAAVQDFFIKDAFITSVKMMALARLMMPDINMVVSTALQNINPQGLTLGIRAGGNVVMPVFTPEKYRADYALYANKESKNLECMRMEVEAAGYRLCFDKWGDSPHYFNRRRAGRKESGLA
jgi:biotin synthase